MHVLPCRQTSMVALMSWCIMSFQSWASSTQWWTQWTQADGKAPFSRAQRQGAPLGPCRKAWQHFLPDVAQQAACRSAPSAQSDLLACKNAMPRLRVLACHEARSQRSCHSQGGGTLHCVMWTLQVFYVESMSNPLIQVADLAKVAEFCKKHGLTAVVDNTFASPVLCTPADLGFIVIHSATKFLNGHSDLLAGVVSGPHNFIERVCVCSLALPTHSCQALCACVSQDLLSQQPESKHLSIPQVCSDYLAC